MRARGLTLAGWVANTVDASHAPRRPTICKLAARSPAPLLGRIPCLGHVPRLAHAEYHATSLARHLPGSNPCSNIKLEGTASMSQIQDPHRPTTDADRRQAKPWTVSEIVMALFELPFNDLMFRAQQAHREQLPGCKRDVELATLLSIKTGGCEEDCGYCPQSARYDTGPGRPKKLIPLQEVMEAARAGQAERRHPLLHGRRLALARSPATWKPSAKPWCRSQGPGPGNLR